MRKGVAVGKGVVVDQVEYEPLKGFAPSQEGFTSGDEDSLLSDAASQKKEAKKNLKKHRFTHLTELDDLYLEEEGYQEFNDPVKWFLDKYSIGLYLSPHAHHDAIKKAQEKKSLFFSSYKEIIKQRNFGHWFAADELFFLDCKQRVHSMIEGELLGDRPTLNHINQLTQSEKFIPKLFVDFLRKTAQSGINLDLEQRDKIRHFIAAYKETLSMRRHEKSWLPLNSSSSSIAKVNELYIDYLNQLVPDEGPVEIDKLQQALTDNFLRFYHDGGKLERGQVRSFDGLSLDGEKLTQLTEKSGAHFGLVTTDFGNILAAYRTNSSDISHGYLLKKKHVYKAGMISDGIITDSGQKFAELVHHFTIIGAFDVLESIHDVLSGEETDAEKIRAISYSVFNHFDRIQARYNEQINLYHDKAIATLWAQVGEGYRYLYSDFEGYCQAVLFGDDYSPEPSKALKDGLGGHKLGKLWHSLRYELKPALMHQKEATNRELKHLKQNIHHFTQANAIHSRIKRVDKARELGFILGEMRTGIAAFTAPLYTILDHHTQDNFLTSLQKQCKRKKNQYAEQRGSKVALLVGLGEGIVAGVALGLAFPIASLAVLVGGIAVLAGTVLNRFLLYTDSIGLLNVLGLKHFNRDSHKIPLGWFQTMLNFIGGIFTMLGTGVVFAGVFATEFIKMIKGFSTAHPALVATVMPLVYIIAGVIGMAELFGISALIHMENRKLIINGLKDVWCDIKDYFVKRFYVPLHDNFADSALAIIDALPRLLYSTVLTVTGAAIMAYYVKIMFVFFSGVVTDLMTTYIAPFLLAHLALHVSAGAAVIAGKVIAGLNAVTTLLSFTLPLGKITLQLLDKVVLPGILRLVAAIIPLIATVLCSPALFCQSGRDFVKNIWQTFMNRADNINAWLTSTSICVPGGLHQTVMKEASKAPVQDVAEAGGHQYNKVKQRHEAINTGWKYTLYAFLGINSCGQGYLIGQKDPKVIDWFVMGGRSLAMNQQGIVKCSEAEQGGKVMPKENQNGFFVRERDAALERYDIPLIDHQHTSYVGAAA